MAATGLVSVDGILDKKSSPVIRDPATAPTHDLREELFELEARGELIVQRVPEPYVEVHHQIPGARRKSPSSTPGITSPAASAVTSPATRLPSSGCTASLGWTSWIPRIKPRAPAGTTTLRPRPTRRRSWPSCLATSPPPTRPATTPSSTVAPATDITKKPERNWSIMQTIGPRCGVSWRSWASRWSYPRRSCTTANGCTSCATRSLSARWWT